jgi:hypothetical protein
MRHLPLWPTGSAGNPLALFPVFVISVIALSVLLTWLYNGTEGSPLLVVLLHATPFRSRFSLSRSAVKR